MRRRTVGFAMGQAPPTVLHLWVWKEKGLQLSHYSSCVLAYVSLSAFHALFGQQTLSDQRVAQGVRYQDWLA
jgi:hypothetical protein